MLDLKKSILLTISYFDMFDYPLSRKELWSSIFNPPKNIAPVDFIIQLKTLLAARELEFFDDFYFLPGRRGIIDIRKERYAISFGKIKKARLIGGLLRFVPGLRMLAVCSNVAYFNASADADIDFFIITADGRIWTVRFWATLLMKILAQRPTKKKMKNKICLSYFVTNNYLSLEHTQVCAQDFHLIYLLSEYLPIYSENKIWQEFCSTNVWLLHFLPNFHFKKTEKHIIIKSANSLIKKFLALILFMPPDSFYEKLQKIIMPIQLKQAATLEDKSVIINNQMLKLHLNDRRREYNAHLSKILDSSP